MSRLVCTFLVLLILAPSPARAAKVQGRLPFDLSAGPAGETLRRFASQSGCELVFGSLGVDPVPTKAVRGEYAPREALDRMLAGTGLTAVQDAKTGAYAISRSAVLPKKTGVAPKPGDRDRPAEPAATRPTLPVASTASAESRAATLSEQKTSAHPVPMKTTKPTGLFGVLAALFAFSPADNEAQTTPNSSSGGETVVLSPFTVTTDKDVGYYGASTMSGTRLNTKLEDIGASISVVTKQQMLDLALLNMDDIFSYEAGTEGTATFTDFAFDRNQVAIDNTQFNPLSANRIRGIGPANVSFGNFETSGRTPIDVLDVDAVEIGRGPNSNVFGIGNASGTVNTVRAAANLSRNRSQVSVRADSYDGYRTSLDLNRVLKPGTLAVRGTAVAQREGFPLKPSGVLTERYNGMVRWQPFRTTSISGS